jgi:tRNA nucleotidyltransferase (CCA-adding enzyme)
MRIKKKLLIPPLVKKVIRKIRQNGFEAYLVGGAVRDLLLGRGRGDFDITTNAKPAKIMKIFAKTVPTGIKHGTVTVIEHGRSFEVTTYRKEGKYSDSRRPDSVKFISNLKEDLSRRDFTINAMAYDVDSNLLIDPFSGKKDLQGKTIRTVGNPLKRFREDALRPIRAARFAAALGFKVEPKTLFAMGCVLKKIAKISSERIRDELLKILESNKPSIGLNLLKESGILRTIMPELAEAEGFDQGGLHDFDLLTHSFLAADNAPKSQPLLRFAALMHDIAKTQTRIIDGKNYHFYGHDSLGATETKRIMKRLKFSNKDIEYVVSLIRNHMFNYNSYWKDSALRRLLARTGKDNIDDLLKLREADARACGRNRKPGAEFYQLKRRIKKVKSEDLALKVTDLPVNGNDVMKTLGIGPGKVVGDILKQLLEIVMDDKSKNSRPKLLKMIKSLGEKL